MEKMAIATRTCLQISKEYWKVRKIWENALRFMITHTVHSDRKSLVCIIACTKKSACNITRNLLCLHSTWSCKI